MRPYIKLLRPLVERNYTEYSGLSDRSDQSILFFDHTDLGQVRTGQVTFRPIYTLSTVQTDRRRTSCYSNGSVRPHLERYAD